MTKVNTIIIGSGPAACSAAIFSTNLDVTMITGEYIGGPIVYKPNVINYPGIVISGKELIENMFNQIKNKSTKIVNEIVIAVEQDKDKLFIIKTDRNTYISKQVIVATGSKHRILSIDLPKSDNILYFIKNIDIFENKIIIIVGGGQVSVESAIRLSKASKQVILIYRKSVFNAFEDSVNELKKISNIKILNNSEILKVESINNKLKVEIKSENNILNLESEILLIQIGRTANISFLNQLKNLNLNKDGYVIVDRNQRTSISNLYACGDCAVFSDNMKTKSQAIISSQQGCVAALSANEDSN